MMSYLGHLAILIIIYSILAVSLDLAVGRGGILNLGHIAFFGIGAYTSTLLVMNSVPFLLGLLGAGFLAGITGFILALPTARLSGDYLAVATLGFGFIVESLMRNLSVTRGALGIPGIPKPSLLGMEIASNFSYLVFASAIAGVSLFVMHRLMHSHYGRLVEAIRDDKTAAKSLGVSTLSVTSLTLFIAAFFAGIAGSLYAHYITFIAPGMFNLHELIFVFSIIIVGGLASFRGAIVGAIIMTLLPEPLRFIGLPSSIIGPARQMLFAILLLSIIYFKPKGLFGQVELE